MLTEGEYVEGKVTFPEMDAQLRTDIQFDEMSDEDHHRGLTPLKSIPLGLVSWFVLDYMHLVCLGVVRKLMNFW